MSPGLQGLLGWIGAASAVAFVLFGWDKARAGRRGARRVSESTLCWVCALGGWPGGLAGLLLFRHKSAKGTFQLKFALALAGFALGVWGALEWIVAGQS